MLRTNMKIYTNGCSFVYGDELKDRENEAFPYLLNGDVTNDAQCGISNQNILRTTLDRDLEYDYYIIGWTSIYRYEYYYNEWIGQNPTGGEKFKSMNKTINNQLQWFKDDWFYLNFINQVLTLQNYLKYNQKKFFFFLTFDTINRKDYIDYIRLIDKETFPSLFDEELNFRSYCINNGESMTKGFDGHPTKESHKLWADYLNRIIKK